MQCFILTNLWIEATITIAPKKPFFLRRNAEKKIIFIELNLFFQDYRMIT